MTKNKSNYSNVYVIGGSPCSGKSTIAEKIAAEFNFQYFKVDDYDRMHLEQADSEKHQVMYSYSKMSWNEIWLRPVGFQVQEEFDFYYELFEMIEVELQKFDLSAPIIMEGAACLPDLMKNNGFAPRKVISMVPTKAFQLHHYQQRPWISHILKNCNDPEQAFANWMERDHLFGKEILKQAKKFDFETILVDGKVGLETQYDRVIMYFGLY